MARHHGNSAPVPSAEFQFRSSDGLPITCFRWDGRWGGGEVRGVVQIAHGLGEHIGRYGAAIDALVAAGFTVYGNDHRGHGRTAQSPAQLGDFGPGGFDLLVQDMHQLSRIAWEDHPGTPLFLVGHGTGSFAAQQYALDDSPDIDGLILSGSGALDGLAELVRSAPPGENILNRDFEPARTPLDWLSRDNAVVDAFLADPLCFPQLQPASVDSFFAAAPRLCEPDRLAAIRSDLPVFVFSGGEDPIGQRLGGVRILIDRYRRAGIDDIAHDFYPGARHEMLNETCAAEVRTRVVRWISGVLKGRRHVPESDAVSPIAHEQRSYS